MKNEEELYSPSIGSGFSSAHSQNTSNRLSTVKTKKCNQKIELSTTGEE